MISLNRVRGPATDPLSDYEFDDDDRERDRWMTTPVVSQQTPVQRYAQPVQEDIQNKVHVAPQEKEESEDEDVQDEIRVVHEGEEVVVKQEGVEAGSDDDMEHEVTPALEEEGGPRLDDENSPGLEEEAAPNPQREAVVPAATPMDAAVSAISNHPDPGMIAAVDRNTEALNRLAAAQEEHNRLLALQLQRLN